MINSRRKGASGEREFAVELFNLTGVRLLRQLDQCRSGGYDLAPDIADTSDGADCLRRFAIEIKRYRVPTPALIKQWWTQADMQARSAGLEPLLAYRGDRMRWAVMLPLHTLHSGLPGCHTATVSVEALSLLVLEQFGASTSTAKPLHGAHFDERKTNQA